MFKSVLRLPTLVAKLRGDGPPPDQDFSAEIYTGGPLLTLAVISPTCRGLLLIERSRGGLRAPRVAREVTVIPRLSQRCRTLIWMTMRVYRGPPCINLSRILLVGWGPTPSILLPWWVVSEPYFWIYCFFEAGSQKDPILR